MSFAHPWWIAGAVAAAGLFLVLYRWAQRRRASSALRYSNLAFLTGALQSSALPARLLAAGWVAAVALLVLGVAGPRVRAFVPVRDGTVVLCVDTSGSMASEDVAPTRAAAAAAAVRAFVRRTPPGIAIGIVAFSSGAGAIVPPTRDRDAVLAAVDRIPLPDGATAIGDALNLALREFPARGHRVVVLITDGVNNAGADPLAAARALGSRGISLYTIGIGTNSGALIPGTLQAATIDEDALRAYAAAAHGAYSRVQDAAQLREALARLGRTTTFERGTLDLALPAAVAGGVLMVLTFLAGVTSGRYP